MWCVGIASSSFVHRRACKISINFQAIQYWSISMDGWGKGKKLKQVNFSLEKIKSGNIAKFMWNIGAKMGSEGGNRNKFFYVDHGEVFPINFSIKLNIRWLNAKKGMRCAYRFFYWSVYIVCCYANKFNIWLASEEILLSFGYDGTGTNKDKNDVIVHSQTVDIVRSRVAVYEATWALCGFDLWREDSRKFRRAFKADIVERVSSPEKRDWRFWT